MPELQVIARYRLAEGHESEVFDLLGKLAAATRGEPGNVSFVSYQSVEDDRDVVLLERYTSREAFTAHRDTAHFQELVLDQIVPRLDSRTIESFDVLE
jgi:(4S)-4-hydroxy-5-phosphonooxypentane-2,3-dione isomerase